MKGEEEMKHTGLLGYNYTHEIEWIEKSKRKILRRKSLGTHLIFGKDYLEFEYENGWGQSIKEKVPLTNIISIRYLKGE